MSMPMTAAIQERTLAELAQGATGIATVLAVPAAELKALLSEAENG